LATFARCSNPAERDQLRHDAAERPAEQVDLRQSEGLDELDRAVGEPFRGVAWFAAGVADADVVEQDHVAVRGQPVDELRVPPVDGAAEAHQQDQRHATPRTGATVGEHRGRTGCGLVLEGVGCVRRHALYYAHNSMWAASVPAEPQLT